MSIVIALAVFLVVVLLPWLKVHAVWIGVLGALIIASFMTSGDSKAVVSQAETARSFGKNVPELVGSNVTLKEVFVPDPSKDYKTNQFVTITNTVGKSERDTTWVTDLSATINNNGNARVYDVYLKCKFGGRPPRRIADPELKGTSYVKSDYHYGYIEPGSSQVTVRLEPNGYLQVADPSSFKCDASYEVEKSDLFRRKG
jgi:hypothetical protein